jgi:hypothetical protein
MTPFPTRLRELTAASLLAAIFAAALLLLTHLHGQQTCWEHPPLVAGESFPKCGEFER